MPKVIVVPAMPNCMPLGVPPYTGSQGVTGKNISSDPGSGAVVMENVVLFPSAAGTTLSMTHPITQAAL
jgi:hypothetical protein